MRISFIVAHANLSGGLRIIVNHAERLMARGHDVRIITRPRPVPTLRRRLGALLRQRKWLPDQNTLPSHLEKTPVPVHTIESRRPIVDSDVPDGDVVIATWWETAEWVSRMSPSKGAKVYFLQGHEVVVQNQPVERIEATWRLPMQKIVVSSILLDLARDKYGDSSAVLVPCAVDPRAFWAHPRGKQAHPTVGLLYSADHLKGTDIALDAIQKTAQELRDLQVKSFGATEVFAHLPLPQGADYACRASQEAIRNIYASCDVWLFASRYEGFGLPLLEAMACRTPVVATPAGAARELLASGGGILVPGEDSEAMARAIVRICSMPDSDWRELSDKAYAAVSSYTWDDASARFDAALRSAVGVKS